MGETMKNKIMIAGALFLILGMTGAAQQDQNSSNQEKSLQMKTQDLTLYTQSINREISTV